MLTETCCNAYILRVSGFSPPCLFILLSTPPECTAERVLLRVAGPKLMDPEFKVRVDSSEGRVCMSFIDACFGDPEIDERIELSVEVTMTVDKNDNVSCSVDIDTGIQMPSPISSAPRPLLNSISSLVAKIILRSILPNFLDSLRKDFQQWQTGKTLEERWTVARDSSLLSSATQAQAGELPGLEPEASAEAGPLASAPEPLDPPPVEAAGGERQTDGASDAEDSPAGSVSVASE